METIDMFFYKLSRKIIAFWDLIKGYYNGSTNDEKILIFVLLLVVLIFLYVVFVLVLRSNFNRRIKKLGFVNVMHINIANEVHDKNLFIRFFLFFWNFNKLTIVEAKPLVSIEPLIEEIEETTLDEQESESMDEEVDELVDEEEFEPVDEDITPEVEEYTAETTSQTIVLSDEIERLIEKRFEELTKTMEETLNNHLSNRPKDEKAINKPEIVEEDPVMAAPLEELIEVPTEEFEDEINEVTEEEKQVTPTIENEPDLFFDKVVVKKYIVRKHPISGWQVIKEGSKRATRLFNTKKQAVAFATKSKYDFIVL